MNKALKVVLLLVLVLAAVYTGKRIADCYPPRPHPSPGPMAQREAERTTVEEAIEALMYEKGITDLSKYSDNTPTGDPVRTFDAGEAVNDIGLPEHHLARLL